MMQKYNLWRLFWGITEIALFTWIAAFWLPNYMATRVTVAAVAVDPFQDLWLKHYRPVSDKMITEYGKIELQQFSQKKSHCELKVKCGNVVITGEGKDFKAAFDAFYEKAMAPEIMPYEDD